MIAMKTTTLRLVPRLLLVGSILGSHLLLADPARADLPPDPGPNVEVSDVAREDFRIGVALLQDPDGARYEEAYRAFLKAYTESPSWKILVNLGLCALKLERFGDGIEAYERYLEHGAGEISDGERAQIERDLRVMKATSGQVSLAFEGASDVSLQDSRARSVGGPIRNTYEVPAGQSVSLVLAAGEHTLMATSGTKRAELKLEVKSGAQLEQTMLLSEPAAAAPVAVAPVSTSPQESTPPPEPQAHSSGMRTAGYAVGGTGIALLIAGGVTTAMGYSKKGKLNDACPDQTCAFDDDEQRDTFKSDQDTLKTFGLLSTVFLAGGGVFAATGATLVILGRQGPKEQAGLRLDPLLSPSLVGLSAKGAF
jgi:tetratricopeptide (TPR) repeat protein